VPPEPRKTTAKKTTAKKTTAKKTTAKKSTAKKTTAKQTTAKTTAKQTAAPSPAALASSATKTARDVAASALGGANLAAGGVEEAVERIRGLQAALLETARSGGAAYLQAYESALSSMLELTQGAAESSQLSWAVNVVNTYSDFVKRVNDTVLKAGRQTLG
jgi:outer membrane biosynthesis protein TonB